MLVLVTMLVGAALVFWLVGAISEAVGRFFGWVIIFALATAETIRRRRAKRSRFT